MSRLFKAIGRAFKMFLAVISFGLIRFTEELELSEAGVAASYDEIRDGHVKTMKQAMKGLAITTRMKNELQSRVEKLGNDLNKLHKQRAGAEALIKKRLSVVGKENIKSDAEYQKLANLYNRVDEHITNSEEEVERLEKEQEKLLHDLEIQERELAEMGDEKREIDKEEAATQSDLAYSKTKKELAEARAGIATSGSGETRQRMQQLRRQRNAEAEAAGLIAGATNDDAIKDLERAAMNASSNDKLDALLGLSEEVEATTVGDSLEMLNDKLPE